jgi:hypothetical protein
VTETLIHLDKITVAPGQYIPAGGQVGFSGGQLSGGLHPTTSQYSSGPHTEIDFFSGAPWSSASTDPAPILANIGKGGSQPVPNSSGDLVNFSGLGVNLKVGNPLDPLAGVPAALAAIPTAIAAVPTSIGHGLADALGAGVTDVGVWFRRQSVALFVALIVLLVLFL